MNVPKLNPFSTWSQWLAVYSNLPSSLDISDHKSLLNTLNQWKYRGQLPVGVECTCLILTCNEFLGSNIDINQETTARLSLSSTVVRVVNGFIDSLQTPSDPQPVSVVASRIGLPLEFVDFRHDATHGILPTLKLAQYTVRRLYQWIYQHYWNNQAQYLYMVQQVVFEFLTEFYRERLLSPNQDFNLVIQHPFNIPSSNKGLAINSYSLPDDSLFSAVLPILCSIFIYLPVPVKPLKKVSTIFSTLSPENLPLRSMYVGDQVENQHFWLFWKPIFQYFSNRWPQTFYKYFVQQLKMMLNDDSKVIHWIQPPQNHSIAIPKYRLEQDPIPSPFMINLRKYTQKLSSQLKFIRKSSLIHFIENNKFDGFDGFDQVDSIGQGNKTRNPNLHQSKRRKQTKRVSDPKWNHQKTKGSSFFYLNPPTLTFKPQIIQNLHEATLISVLFTFQPHFHLSRKPQKLKKVRINQYKIQDVDDNSGCIQPFTPSEPEQWLKSLCIDTLEPEMYVFFPL